MIRVKELVNAYNLSPLAGNTASVNSLFVSLFNPLFSSLSVFYILINKSSFGEIFFYLVVAVQPGPECAMN